MCGAEAVIQRTIADSEARVKPESRSSVPNPRERFFGLLGAGDAQLTRAPSLLNASCECSAAVVRNRMNRSRRGKQTVSNDLQKGVADVRLRYAASGLRRCSELLEMKELRSSEIQIGIMRDERMISAPQGDRFVCVLTGSYDHHGCYSLRGIRVGQYDPQMRRADWATGEENRTAGTKKVHAFGRGEASLLDSQRSLRRPGPG
jgi:hypothetical protein